MAEMKTPRPGWRTWGDGTRCAHCCNGDRCDDPTHYDRTSKPGCPHCLNTGYALWTEAGYAKAEKNGRLANVTRPPAPGATPQAAPAPAVREPLTDEQLAEITVNIYGSAIHPKDHDFARAIEQAHGITGGGK